MLDLNYWDNLNYSGLTNLKENLSKTVWWEKDNICCSSVNKKCCPKEIRVF